MKFFNILSAIILLLAVSCSNSSDSASDETTTNDHVITHNDPIDNDTNDPDAAVSQTEIGQLIARHNHWRADVGVGKVEYSSELAKVAQAWAEKLAAEGCQMKHSTGSGYGENLFMGTIGYTAADAVDAWGSEKADYTYGDPFSAATGHYTQIIWAKSTRIGCGKVTCNGNVLWVCNYDPPGNFQGENPY